MNRRSSKQSDTTTAKATDEEQQENFASFPIVAMGASAGGLEAYTEILRNLPKDTGMAFVLIQHLAPHQKSMLSELLSRVTEMPVTEVQDGIAVEPNHVYVIPPNAKMTLAQGVLKLAPRGQTRGQFMSVDEFFVSLAQEWETKGSGSFCRGRMETVQGG